MKVLAIGAHGDDLEEFCGGTLARYAKAGDHVVMCVVTDGQGNPMGDPNEIAAIRKAEALSSAALIGAELVWMAIPDGGLIVDQASRQQFIEVIRAASPDIIITHPQEDYHPDHMATSRLVIEAAQIARTRNYPSEHPPIRQAIPVAFMDAELGINFTPEDYVDITDVWDTKIQMLMKHVSQHMPGPTYDPNFVMGRGDLMPLLRMTRVMSEFRGMACGVNYAEGFRWWRAANRILPTRLLP